MLGYNLAYNQQQMQDQIFEFITNPLGAVEIVGFGSYGQVKLAINRKSNEVVAIKQIYNKNAKDEIDVHHKLNHPHIIKLLNYYYEKDKNITYMILQYASGGSLNQKIKQSLGFLSKSLIHRYFKQICQAVKYLHENGFMHRDIKPQNILINKENNIKLCDFGFASLLEYRSTVCGTFQYMAPQMIQQKPYDYRIDIWALGILLFEMIQGQAPFRGNTENQVIGQMKKTIHFSNRFQAIQIDLIKKILRVNAENRIQVKQILEHAYFKNFQQNNYEKDLQDSKSNEKGKAELIIPAKMMSLNENKVERKLDFLIKKTTQKKQQTKKQQLIINKDTILNKQQIFNKQILQPNQKKQQIKKQFKPYIPVNIQNNRNNIKTPIIKPQLNATTFQQNQQLPNSAFNNSMHMPSTQPTTLYLNQNTATLSSKQLHNIPQTNIHNYLPTHSHSQQFLNNQTKNIPSNLNQNRSPTNIFTGSSGQTYGYTPNYWRKQ